MIKGLASINGIVSVAENNIQSFEGIFEGLRYKLPVKITLDDEEVYSNIPSKDEKTENNWKFLLVEWVDNQEYEISKKEVTNPKEKSNYPNWHRIDSVKVFEPEEMMASLRKL